MVMIVVHVRVTISIHVVLWWVTMVTRLWWVTMVTRLWWVTMVTRLCWVTMVTRRIPIMYRRSLMMAVSRSGATSIAAGRRGILATISC